MNSVVYVGMDVHKESYTLCCYCYDTDKVEYKQTIPSDYKLILKYMESMRKVYGEDATFICGYEAGRMPRIFIIPSAYRPCCRL